MAELVLGSLEDFQEATPRHFDTEHGPIVAVRIGGQVFALEDRCSHEDFPLSDGIVDAEFCEIECARHGAMFSLETGAACSLPAIKPVATVQVLVAEGQVKAVFA